MVFAKSGDTRTDERSPRLRERAAGNNTFTLAHLSDPHVFCPDGARAGDLLTKRLYGYVSWRLHRRTEHESKVLAAVLVDLERTKPDHIVVTGDLTHLGLPSEFQKASHWLCALGPPSNVTVIPGNHDAYVAEAWDRTFALWADYMLSDETRVDVRSEFDLHTIFPSLRVRGTIALIGVSSALPTAPFLAVGNVGQTQLHKLQTILAETGRRGLFRVVLIHHPPVPGKVRWRKRLKDGGAFRSVLARYGAELVLHGHVHRISVGEFETCTGETPAIGVTSASALGRRPDRTARYHLYRVTRHAKAWEVVTSVRAYSLTDKRFVPEGERHQTVPHP